LNLKRVDEVWGWNSSSQPYWFWVVTPQLPPGMPTGESIYEEATFVGYFLKLLPYEDHTGRHLATPLLIGRIIWHPQPANPLVRSDEWTWPWLVALGVGTLLVLRWGFRLAGFRRAGARAPLDTPDEAAVESWLDSAQTGAPDTDRPPADDERA
jgi:hypothetical protein